MLAEDVKYGSWRSQSHIPPSHPDLEDEPADVSKGMRDRDSAYLRKPEREFHCGDRCC
jgi:hypothetical protein